MPDNTRPQPFCWRACSISHPGSVRSNNEDAVLCRDEAQLWAVADGMGGHSRGDLASSTLVRHLARCNAGPSLADAVDAVEESLLKANIEVLNYANTHCAGAIVGSTFVAVLIRGNLGFVAWAGDSRLYRLRNNQLRAITRDHSRVQELADQGRRPEDIQSVGANVITRALGVDEFLPMDMTLFSTQPGDTFLLCSDGLYNALDETALITGLKQQHPVCQQLLDAALHKGAMDNVSAVVLRAVPWSAH